MINTILKIQDASFNTLAYLNKLEEGYLYEELNGALTLEFTCEVDLLKTPHLYDTNNFVVYDDDLFKVVEIEEIHNTTTSVIVSVIAEHYTYDLINTVHETFIYKDCLAAVPLQAAVNGTPFAIRTCELTNKATINYDESEVNSKQAICSIAQNWGGELGYYKNYIDLLSRRGADRGVDFRFRKNMTEIRRITKPKEGKVTYEVKIEQGSELSELGYFELGDTVRVVDDMLGIDVNLRITSLKKDIILGTNSDVVLGKAVADLRSSFSSVAESVQEVKDVIATNSVNWNRVSEIVDESGTVVLGKLNTLTSIATKIVNQTGTYEQKDNGMYWQDQPTKAASTFATFWGAEGLTFANSKDSSGEWIWQLAISANGVIATDISSSCLNTITANVINLVVDNLVGKTITGVTIQGSTIYAGDRENGTYTEITSDGVIQGYCRGKKTIHIDHATEGRIFIGLNIDGGTNEAYMEINSQTGYNGGAYPGVASKNSQAFVVSAPRLVVTGDIIYTGNLIKE